MEKNSRYIAENMESCLQISDQLSPRAEEVIRAVYGPSRTVDVPHDIRKAPTPEDAFDKAQAELNKFKEKGFIQNADISRLKNPVYRNRIINKQALPGKSLIGEEESTPQSDLKKLIEAEPFQEFYFNSDTVKEISREISNLPFKWGGEERINLGKLQDAISSIVRVLQHENMLDEKKRTRKQLCHAMGIFVSQARDFRVKLLTEIIKGGKVNNDKLTPQQKEEFKDVIPVPPPVKKDDIISQLTANTPTAKQAEIDKKLLEHITANTMDLPESYKMDINEIDEDRRAGNIRQTKKLLTILPKIITDELKPVVETKAIRPSTSDEITREIMPTHRTRILAAETHKPVRLASLTDEEEEVKLVFTDEQIHSIYWNNDDPLGRAREGKKVDSLADIHKTATDFHFNQPTFVGEPEIPFQCESKPRQRVQPNVSFDVSAELSSDNFPTIREEIWSTRNISSRLPTERELAKKSGFDGSGTLTAADFAAINADSRKRQSSALQFLMKQTFISTNEGPSNTNDKLSQIWTELGFSIQQKLELLLKYTKDSDDSQKFTESLAFWEQALEISKVYDNNYRKYRDFLKYDAPTSPHASKLIAQYDSELKASEENVLQIASTLKTSFGDELIFKRKKVQDLIESHKAKIKRIKDQLVL